MREYLQASKHIDWKNASVRAKASELASQHLTDLEIVRSCFEFVRDEIKHSGDYQLNPVTLRASDVLEHRTGYCYAKSHLLAALLRANGIPTALCYQRLTVKNDHPPFCLHGLNSVYLKDYGWIRIDARGNKDGVDAQFDPPQEIIAFEAKSEGEENLEGRYAEPLKEVVDVLTHYPDFESVANNLPDRITS